MKEERNTDEKNIWLTKMHAINFWGFQKNPPNCRGPIISMPRLEKENKPILLCVLYKKTY